MTPNISNDVMASRPLYDPPPGTIHVKDLVRMEDRKKNRLSDYLVGAIAIAVKVGAIFKYEADIFETVYKRGAKIRKMRRHEGEPFLDPDGKIMKIDGEAYSGSSRISVGRFDINNVDDHPAYKDWCSRLIFAGRGDADSQVGDSNGEEGDLEEKADAEVKREEIKEEEEEMELDDQPPSPQNQPLGFPQAPQITYQQVLQSARLLSQSDRQRMIADYGRISAGLNEVEADFQEGQR